MKKNKMMRLASVLLVAVLMTTSVISGTFAKYTTQDNASDTARVAKWGISLQVVGDLYGKNYSKATDNTKTISTDDAAISVESSDTSNILAPGTKNLDGMSFGLTGTPEVDYQITTSVSAQNIFLKEGTYGLMVPVEANIVSSENFNTLGDLYVKTSLAPTTYELAGSFAPATTYYTLEDAVVLDTDADPLTTDNKYYPVVYSLTGATGDASFTTGNINADSLAEIANLIVDKLAGSDIATATPDSTCTSVYTDVVSAIYNSNVAINTLMLSNMQLKWEWAITSGDMYDGADTILGNLADNTVEGDVVKLVGTEYVALENYTDYCLNTSFDLNIKVEQVD